MIKAESVKYIKNIIYQNKNPIIISLILFIIFLTVSVWLIHYMIQETIKSSIVAYTETMKISEDYECGMKRVSLQELRQSVKIMNDKTGTKEKNVEKLVTGIALKTGGQDGRFLFTLNQNITVTYSFYDTSSTIADSEFDLFEYIVNTKINPFVNITFTRISTYDDADLKIKFIKRTGQGTGAWAYLGVGFYGKNPGMEYDSRIFTDARFDFFKVTCIVHEFGHILSLGHEFLHTDRGNLLNRDSIHQDYRCYNGSCPALQCNGDTSKDIYDVLDSCKTNSPICPEVCSSINTDSCMGVAKNYTLAYGSSRYTRYKDANTFVTTPYDPQSIMGYQSIPARYYCDPSQVYTGNGEFSNGDKRLLQMLYPSSTPSPIPPTPAPSSTPSPIPAPSTSTPSPIPTPSSSTPSPTLTPSTSTPSPTPTPSTSTPSPTPTPSTSTPSPTATPSTSTPLSTPSSPSSRDIICFIIIIISIIGLIVILKPKKIPKSQSTLHKK